MMFLLLWFEAAIAGNVRVYEPLRDSNRFVVELPQPNQKNNPSQTRCQQWLIHAVVRCRFYYLFS